MRSLPKEYVSKLLSYDKETGVFIWLVHRGSIKPGRVAGTKSLGRDRPLNYSVNLRGSDELSTTR